MNNYLMKNPFVDEEEEDGYKANVHRKITLFCKKLELYKSGTAPEHMDDVKVKEVVVKDDGLDDDLDEDAKEDGEQAGGEEDEVMNEKKK